MIDNPRWRYGDSWEHYPIVDGATWTHTASGSAVTVHDVRDHLPAHMHGVDMLYSDPPWNQGNVNSFVTKAGKTRYVRSFAEFLDAYFAAVALVAPRVLYLEAGVKQLGDVMSRIPADFRFVENWPIRYYRKHPCCLIRAAMDIAAPFDPTGMDDADIPLAAIQAEAPASVADLCTGRGLTLLAAHQCGLPFHGTELNRRRLAVAIERAAVVGVAYRPDDQ
jgi:hypothetical protein